jgi:hypothetical protein
MIITEAIAWGKKYLIQSSVWFVLILWINKGTILIKLISSPIQAKNQELEDTAIVVPTTKNVININ